MKRIKYILLLLSVIVLTSCWKDTYDKPKKTAYAYGLTQRVQESINLQFEVMNNIKYIDKWKYASTDNERYSIEDTYFQGYKVRKTGTDTITLTGQGAISYAIIYKNGKRYNEEGAEREVMISRSTTIEIVFKEGQWTFTAKQEAQFKNSPTYDVLFIGESTMYFKEGNSFSLQHGSKGTYIAPSGKEYLYEVTEQINRDYLINNSGFEWTSGTLTIDDAQNHSGEEQILAKFKSQYHIEITYRGFSEVWG